MRTTVFKKLVWNHYKKHGRHNLPWRPIPKKKLVTPYQVLVSEIMLQQTQVDRVIPKYKSFIKQFPNFKQLARAPLKDVLKAWQGLGYNRRALNFKRTAEIVTTNHYGKLPQDKTKLLQLPGIGPYTAGAIQTFAFNRPALFIETNVRSVFLHHFFPNRKDVNDKELLPFVEKTLDTKNPREWYYALMDYGAYLKKHTPNPNRRSKHHTKQSPFKGSNRELRGKILKTLLRHPQDIHALAQDLSVSITKLRSILKQLERDGLIRKRRTTFVVA